jgi:hypothetical protein
MVDRRNAFYWHSTPCANDAVDGSTATLLDLGPRPRINRAIRLSLTRDLSCGLARRAPMRLGSGLSAAVPFELSAHVHIDVRPALPGQTQP